MMKLKEKYDFPTDMTRNEKATYAKGLEKIENVATALDLPKYIKQGSANIYQKVIDNKLVLGRKSEVFAIACVYLTTKRSDTTRTLTEFSKETKHKEKEIGQAFRHIVRELDIKIKPTEPQEYIPKFCEDLRLDGKVKPASKQLLDKAKEKNIVSGKSPTSLAAAAIYIAGINTGERRSQREVSNVAGVCTNTLRDRYRELSEKLDINVDVSFNT